MVQPKYNPQEALERVKLMMKYDLSKTSTENKKVIEEQAQPNSDPFACVKNYALLKGLEIKTSTSAANYIWVTFVDTSGNETNWFFDNKNGNNEWSEMVNGKFKQLSDKTGYGKWECDGNKNFKITKNDGSIYKSSDPNAKRTVEPKPEKLKPEKVKKQPDSDPSRPQKLKPKDSPLGTTLKDTSIPKRSCVVYVDQLFEAWERSRGQKFDTNQINELRGYVQRCMDDHFPSGSKQGNWGITGLGGGKTDQKLLQLSACKSPAPSQSGPDSIFRLARKC
jgi:hypothetical protein